MSWRDVVAVTKEEEEEFMSLHFSDSYLQKND
jgi:hypothetical protein